MSLYSDAQASHHKPKKGPFRPPPVPPPACSALPRYSFIKAWRAKIQTKPSLFFFFFFLSKKAKNESHRDGFFNPGETSRLDWLFQDTGSMMSSKDAAAKAKAAEAEAAAAKAKAAEAEAAAARARAAAAAAAKREVDAARPGAAKMGAEDHSDGDGDGWD